MGFFKPDFNWLMLLEYISVFSIINFLLLAVLLRIKKTPNKKANNILCVLLILMFVYSVTIFFHYTTLTHQSYSYLKYYTPVDGIFLLLMAPCLYFYVRAVLNIPIKGWNWKLLYHSLPLLPCVVFNVYFSTYSFPQRIDWLVRDFVTGTVEMSLLNVVLYAQIIGYLFASYFLAKKQLKISTTIVIDNYSVDVSWLKVFLLINISFILVSTPFCFFLDNERANIIIGQIAMDIQYLYLFFKTLLPSDSKVLPPVLPLKNVAFSIPSETSNDYLTLIEKHFQTDKPYLNEDYNIRSMSEQTGIPVHHISQTLHTHYQQTFTEFVNQHQVEEAKRLLTLPNSSGQLNIESIGFDCGFGSRVTFIRVFKKYTNNLTPSDYRRQFKQSQQLS